ncbi:MAG TPA: hypothetical protein VHO24_19710 [Opitutaceae bacterium]|nr:hypothetical protein [Opitutaceae bacterium]
MTAANGAAVEAKSFAAPKPPAEDVSEAAVAAVYDRRPEEGPAENGGHRPPLQEISSAAESTNTWNDEAAESAFRAEARERGEPVQASRAVVESVEENSEPKNLPPLDELVKRLSPEIRETLDDLFRAKFTSVRRVSKKALKSEK